MSDISVVNEDCVDFLMESRGRKYTVIFADPPDNIGLRYEGSKDKMSSEEYEAFFNRFIYWSMVIAEKGVWISFNARHTVMVSRLVSQWVVTPCVQVITFGNQRTVPGKLTNNYRPMWFISHNEPDFNDVREPSWRQLNGDKRADPRGKLVSDVFNFPRVTGNSKQRRIWHPTQLNEGLVERCIRLTAREGDNVLDIFAGTGTTGRVCKKLNINCTLVEKSEAYCRRMKNELCGIHSVDDSFGHASCHADRE